jgi:zinc transport system substrate-binding protein
MKQSIALFLLLAVLYSCGNNKKSDSEGTIENSKTIAVTNYPLYFFTQKIAGNGFDVIFPVPGDIDPAFFEPRADVVSSFQSTEVIFINGAGYESWIDKVSLPRRKIVNTSSMVSDRYIQEKGMSHSHGPDGEHDHAETAFTTWLDQSIALEQARLIYETLKQSFPEYTGEFTMNFGMLEEALMGLDQQLEMAFTPYREMNVYASHPVYQYLGKRYGLHIHSKHWEPGEKIDNADVKAFLETIDKNEATIMLWEGEPHSETRQLLEDAGLKVVVFLPCGNKPGQGDYLSVMKKNLENLNPGISQ